MKKAPILYLPHGGGPMPLLEDPAHREMIEFLRSAAEYWPRPDAILVISAHWEEDVPTLTSGDAPELIYDYYGFPEHTYSITYTAPGIPEMADEAAELLSGAGIEYRQDPLRGFDHGMFVPLKLIYPEADIPSMQLSLIRGLDPAAHIRLGRALTGLAERNILVVGSGMSYHNLRELMSPQPDAEDHNRVFHQWLLETTTSEAVDVNERQKRLIDWTAAPFSRYCHPREEHLIPLHVCCGMAGEDAGPAREIFSGSIMNRRVSALIWD